AGACASREYPANQYGPGRAAEKKGSGEHAHSGTELGRTQGVGGGIGKRGLNKGEAGRNADHAERQQKDGIAGSKGGDRQQRERHDGKPRESRRPRTVLIRKPSSR